MITLADRYELGDKIGTGGMGNVYQAKDTLIGNTVAIKALKQSLIKDENLTALERFLREADALRQLAHPNIVKILDSFEHKQRHFIVMEYLPGGSLRERVKKNGPLPVEEVVTICLELADALSRSHHLGIIHRDIKPANVLLAEDNTPRLTDFGIAQMSQSSTITSGGVVMGTIPYLSPEALNGEPQDARADIWAFGVMMFELLTGIRPFRGEKTAEVIRAIIMEAPEPDLERLRSRIPASLIGLLGHMLEKDPAQRLASARQIGAALEAILHGHAGETEYIVAPTVKSAPRTLPTVPTTFIGRDADIAKLTTLVTSPDYRMITLIGPGGIGKTRLAIEVAGRIPKSVFSNGIRFVELSPVQSVDSVVPTIATACGYNFPSSDQQSHNPGDVRSNEDYLMDYFSQKNMLLVIDSAEHLPDSVALLERILTEALQVKILVTSRVPLNSQWEYLYEVTGLPVDNDAVDLFVDRAIKVQPRFDLENETSCVTRICQLMEGMPLGLELAATWLRVMSCQELTDELTSNLIFLESRQRTPDQRHASLQAVFEQSWRLLTDAERDGLMRLSVFKGSFSRNAARQVAGTGLGILTALVDQSLVQVTPEGHYRLHEMVRQLSTGKLAEHSDIEKDTLAAHCDYYSRFMERQLPRLKSGEMPEALLDIDTDIDNVRAAWNHAIATHSSISIKRMLESLYHYFVFRANYREGIDDYQAANEAFAGEVIALELQVYQAVFHLGQYEYSLARDMLEAVYDDVAALDNPPLLALTLTYLGHILTNPDEVELGRHFLNEALALYTTPDHAFELGIVNQFLSSTYTRIDDAKSLSYLQASYRLGLMCGNQWKIATALIKLGDSHRVVGKSDLALDYYKEALTNARQFDHSPLVSECLHRMGNIHEWNYSNYELASVLTLEALSLAQETGDKRNIFHCLRQLGWIASMKRQVKECQTYWEQAHKVALLLNDERELRRSFSDLAKLEADKENFDKSIHFSKQAISVAEELGDYPALAAEYGNLAYVAFKAGHYDEGKRYGELGLGIWSEMTYINRPITLALGHMNLAHNLMELRESRDALEHYQTSFHLGSQDRMISLGIMGGVAKTIAYSGDLETAVKLLRFVLRSDKLANHQPLVQSKFDNLIADLPQDELQKLLAEADQLTHDEAVNLMFGHPIWQVYGLDSSQAEV